MAHHLNGPRGGRDHRRAIGSLATDNHLHSTASRTPQMNQIARWIELVAFSSRWLVVPFLLGLMVGLAALIFKFALKLVEFLLHVKAADSTEIITGLLGLVDLTLTANLVVIVICSSYENFVAPIDYAEHPGRPHGLVRIGFAGLRQKLLGSIVAIAAVNVLEWFADIDRQADSVKLAWVVAILLTFGVAMVLLAIADRLSRDGGEL
jgi:uncharacterized protein (TIGR00645 family)